MMKTFSLIAATNNEHKLIEIRQILEPFGIKVFSLKDKGIDVEAVENGKTYKENALIKVNSIIPFTSLPIISDDSGIEIEALDNGPGIHTARYAASVGGYQNAFKIIEEKCLEKNNYKALFNCDIALANVEKDPIIFEGRIKGSIAKNISGANGFGFDPIFISDETGVTNASLSSEDKNKFSARSAALRKLVSYLKGKGYIE